MTGPRWSWVLALALAALGAVALLTRPVAPSVPSAAELGPVAVELTSFDDTILTAVAAWVSPLRVARVAAITLHLAVPLLLVGTRRGRALLRRLAEGRAASWRGAAVVVLAVAVATAPLTVWIGWFHAGAFGFRTSTPGRFVVEEVGAVGLEVVITATGAAVLVALVRRRPADWPALGTVAGTVLTALLVLAAPLVVTELLLQPRPLAEGEVADAVAPVLAASEVDAQTVEVGEASVRTTRANAYVTGAGPTRRVVLYDTLLDRPPDVVASVTAHELAHAESRDVARGALASATGLLAALLLGRVALRRVERTRGPLTPAELGACVAAAAIVVPVVTAPLVAWESRRAEAAADARALELTDDPAALVELQRGFVVEDLADPSPPAWVRLLSSHPTPEQRIARAVAYAQDRDLELDPLQVAQQ